jgi:hypothetical protein
LRLKCEQSLESPHFGTSFLGAIFHLERLVEYETSGILITKCNNFLKIKIPTPDLALFGLKLLQLHMTHLNDTPVFENNEKD